MGIKNGRQKSSQDWDQWLKTEEEAMVHDGLYCQQQQKKKKKKYSMCW
jgi:hypothetical protein